MSDVMAVLVRNKPTPWLVYAELVDGDDVTCVCAYPSGGFEVWLGDPPRRHANAINLPQCWWFEADRGPIARFSTLDKHRRP